MYFRWIIFIGINLSGPVGASRREISLRTMAFYVSDDIREIFFDSDSENEFEGFDFDDILDANHEPPFPDIDEANWREGDREAPALDFMARSGLRETMVLPANAEPLDYFGLFF